MCKDNIKHFTKRSKTRPEQFWAQVQKSDGCWLWQGDHYPNGYGRFWFAGQAWNVHRLAYTLDYGPIPAGLCVCHHCDNPGCVRTGCITPGCPHTKDAPGCTSHLFLGTAADNMSDRDAKGRGRTDHLGVPPEARAWGEGTGAAKLTAAQVRAIRARAATSPFDQAAIATEYGVNQSTISDIVRGVTWARLAQEGGC